MRQLEERIITDGKVLPGGVLKVGSFLNHCIDTKLLGDMAAEIASLYKDAGVTKILTIEASGIAIAAAAGMAFLLFQQFIHKTRILLASVNEHSVTEGEEAIALLHGGFIGIENILLPGKG